MKRERYILLRIVCDIFNVSLSTWYVVVTLPYIDGIHVSDRQMSQCNVLCNFVYFISHYDLLFLPHSTAILILVPLIPLSVPSELTPCPI